MRASVAVVTAMAAVLLAGCVPESTVTPTPSPTPTFMCTPEAGGAEAPCSEQEYQKMKAKDALYAEAEQVYRTYQAEFLKVIRAGGADELTPELKQVIGNSELEEVVTTELSRFKRRNLTIRGPGVKIASAVRRPNMTRNGSLVAMEFCVDSRRTTIYRNSKEVAAGSLGVETAYFAAVDSLLKIVFLESRGVEKC